MTKVLSFPRRNATSTVSELVALAFAITLFAAFPGIFALSTWAGMALAPVFLAVVLAKNELTADIKVVMALCIVAVEVGGFFSARFFWSLQEKVSDGFWSQIF